MIPDKKAELERRYVELLEQRVAALEALVTTNVRAIEPFLGANELSFSRTDQRAIVRMPKKMATLL